MDGPFHSGVFAWEYEDETASVYDECDSTQAEMDATRRFDDEFLTGKA